MSESKVEKPNLSSPVFFFGLALILILIATIFALGRPIHQTSLQFGSCRLKADIARTSDQQALGLSGRSQVPADYAMIFPFHQEQPYFWMKDMLTSIDIVWVSGQKVVKIDSQLPVDDGATQYQAPVPIDWVVEVKSAQSEACSVKEGTIITGLRS